MTEQEKEQLKHEIIAEVNATLQQHLSSPFSNTLESVFSRPNFNALRRSTRLVVIPTGVSEYVITPLNKSCAEASLVGLQLLDVAPTNAQLKLVEKMDDGSVRVVFKQILNTPVRVVLLNGVP